MISDLKNMWTSVQNILIIGGELKITYAIFYFRQLITFLLIL